MASKRCGCASDSCACVITGGVGVEVSGTGAKTNPYVLDATVAPSSLNVQDENALVRAGVTLLDFQGPGVIATAGDAGEVIVNVPGVAAGGATLTSLATTAEANSTATVADMPSLTQTITSTGTADQWTATLCADYDTRGDGTFGQVALFVDGVDTGPKMFQYLDTGTTVAQMRLALAKTWLVTGLAAGAHVLTWKVSLIAGPGPVYITSAHTQAIVQRVK